jgi:alanine racemase
VTDLKWIEIDLGAIRRNLRWARAKLDPGVALMAVVKADAYGHGAAPVAKALVQEGVEALGVLTPAEARLLRDAGIKSKIQLLAPILPENAGDVARLKLTPTIDDLAQARALAAAAPSSGIGVHVDLDFGLGRWGLAPKKLPAFLSALKRLKRLRLEGLSTHIDYVAGKNAVEAEEKLRLFNRIAQPLKRVNPKLACHAANSSVMMDFPHWQLDMVRVGNLLYGIKVGAAKTSPLENPWTFQARIVALHDVARGRSIGYASEYVAARSMRLATLPAGYADGLTMEPAERLISLSGFRYWGMLRETKTPFVGRCGIAHCLVDVTDVSRPRLGEAVRLPIRRTAANAQLKRVYR